MIQDIIILTPVLKVYGKEVILVVIYSINTLKIVIVLSPRYYYSVGLIWIPLHDSQCLPENDTSHSKLALFCQLVSLMDTCNYQHPNNLFELLNRQSIESSRLILVVLLVLATSLLVLLTSNICYFNNISILNNL